MKLKHLNFCILAIGALLLCAIGCEQQPAWRSPFISLSRQVSSDTLHFDAIGGEARILLETSRDWKIDEIPSWALVDPESGVASEDPVSITVTIPENVGYDRIAELLFIAGPSVESIYLHQTGPEGVDDGIIDITCAAFATLPDDDGNIYRLKGAISGSINTTYGNFDVMDETGSVYVYGCTNLDAFKDKIKSGAHISVTGPKTTYNGKVEMKNATIEEITEGSAIRPTNITDISCADFNQLTDTEGWYRLKGVVSGTINTQYGNFDVKDETGSVYVYGTDNIKNYSTFAAGDSVAVVGHYYLYTNANTGATKVEMMNGYIEWYKSNGGGPVTPTGGPDPATVTKATIAEFRAAQPGDGKWYELTGLVKELINTTYGNLILEDATDTVYVYGVVKAYASTNDKSFNQTGVKATDTLTIYTLRDAYGDRVEAGGTIPAVYVSHKAGAGVPTTATHPFTSSLSWTLGNKGTAAKVVIDNNQYDAVKLGTASIAGVCTVTVPAGKSKLNFYALGWNGIDGKLKVSTTSTFKEFTVKQNSGVAGNSPFTITAITDSDWYTFDLGGPVNEDTAVTFETQTGGLRAVIFGINAE